MKTLSKDEFFQRYDIDIREGRLGGGAFGTVYKTWDNLKDEWKAIKIAEVKIINGKEFSLISEFDATKNIPTHKNIINYESVHKFHMPNGVFDYAVMQYYPHGNLKQLVKSNKLSKKHKVEIIDGLFRGLQILHKHGIIHRDIKPSNILISERKDKFTPKIADFGLSKNIDSSEMSAVTNSFGGGTLEYSSPEQLLGQPIRYNADLWAVAVIAYEIFIGQIPFASSEITGSAEAKRRLIYQNIINAPIPPDIELIPEPYKELITKCLVKDPDQRLKTTEEALSLIDDKSNQQSQNNLTVSNLGDTNEDENTIIISDSLEKTKVSNATIVSKESIQKNENTEPKKVKKKVKQEAKKQNIPTGPSSISVFLDSFIVVLKKPFTFIKTPSKNRRIFLSLVLFFLIGFGVYKTYQHLNTGVSFYKKDSKYGILSMNQDTISDAIFDSYTEYKWGSAKALRNDSIFKINKQGNISLYETLTIETPKKRTITQLSTEIETIQNFDHINSIDTLLALLAQNESLESNENFKNNLSRLNLKLDNDTWYETKKQNDLEAYDNYIEQFPDGLHVEEAKNKMNELLEKIEMTSGSEEESIYQNAMKSKQKFALLRYLEKFPNGKYRTQVNIELRKIDNKKEETDWTNALKKNTVVAINEFLKKYPSSSKKQRALELKNQLLLDEAKSEWKKVENSKDLKALRNYNIRFPNSPYIKKSQNLILNIEAENILIVAINNKDLDQLNLVINKYPNTSAAERAQENINKIEKDRANEIASSEEPEIVEPIPNDKDNLPEALSKVLSNISDKMVKIKGGEFAIGCTEDCDKDNKVSKPVLVKDFYISKFEVSQSEYLAVMGINPSTFKDCMSCPVENVSFYDAQEFIKKLNLLSKTNYRLPSEYEWEYAARAKTNSKYVGGNDLIKVGVYRSNSNNGTQKSGTKNPNGYGLYDLSGNVYEWCDSNYTKDGYGEDKKYTNEKILRGGSWRSRSEDCRVDVRGKSVASTKNGWTGFRLAKG